MFVCKQFAFLLFLVSSLSLYVQKPWVADKLVGIYKNPVIRVGTDYYMTASSFNCMPVLPNLHSKDLVNWRVINHALKKQTPTEVYDLPQYGKGVWAPGFQYHN